jgi:hypothetical protein
VVRLEPVDVTGLPHETTQETEAITKSRRKILDPIHRQETLTKRRKAIDPGSSPEVG